MVSLARGWNLGLGPERCLFSVAIVAATLFMLVGTGFVRYFPPHVKTMYDRATYYWSGDVSLLADGPGIGL